MKIDRDKKSLGLEIIVFLGWMISFGIFPVLIFFSEDKKDFMKLLKALFYVALAYIVFSLAFKLYFYIKERIKKSEEVKDIRLSLSFLFSIKIVKRIILGSIVLCILFLVAINFWGTTELDKPFNKFYYEAIYEANLSKVSSLKNVERIQVWVKIRRNLFFKKEIQLDYINYKNKDFEFDEDNPVYLEVGKFVPVEFYVEGKYYNWYIEMSINKVSDYIYIN